MSERDDLAPRGEINPQLLLEAFEKFTLTSKLMEQAYHDLQRRLEELNLELEKKNIELSEQLKATEMAYSLLADVLDSLRSAVVVVDGAGVVTRLNRAGEALFGMEERAAVGQPACRLFDPHFDDPAELACLWQAADPVPETEIGDLDGATPRVWRFSTYPLRGAGGAGEGRIILVEDITELALRRRDAARTDRLAAMGEMAVQIVHEIRNPMGSIELFASLLERDLAKQPENAELARKVQQGIKGLNHVINNLLSFAKGAEPVLEWVGMTKLVETALADVAHQLARQNIEVVRELEPEADQVRVDPELWRQVLLNILLNAVQAMPGGGRLTVGNRLVRDEQGQVFHLFSIADTGEGMSSQVRDRIFHPFFTTKDRGTGLGMALVHNIVKAHGGLIGVESTPGHGATINVVLPL